MTSLQMHKKLVHARKKMCYLWRGTGQEAVNLYCKEVCVQKLKEASPKPVRMRAGALPAHMVLAGWHEKEEKILSSQAFSKAASKREVLIILHVFQEAESQCGQEGSSGFMTLEELLSWPFSPAGRLCPGVFAGERRSSCSWNRTLPSAALLCLVM